VDETHSFRQPLTLRLRSTAHLRAFLKQTKGQWDGTRCNSIRNDEGPLKDLKKPT
jgi:hypothetical protein